MAVASRWRWWVVGVSMAVVALVVPAGCARTSIPCPVSDLSHAGDLRTATRALEAAAAALGMADVPTQSDTVSSRSTTNLPGTSGDDYEQDRLRRAMLVEFAPIEPGVKALERRGFRVEGGGPDLGDAYHLERGQQRATVGLGERLRGQDGKVWLSVEVVTGCRKTGS